MEHTNYIDIFATKGIEYLLVIGYLIVLIYFWRILNMQKFVSLTHTNKSKRTPSGWFHLADGFYFHQGHSWAKPESNTLVKVGIDDFAQKLLGKPDSIHLPKIGSRLRQGEKGWQIKIDSKAIDMLSPVDGEVVNLNKEVLQRPDLILSEPYQKGWLMELKVKKLRPNLWNLLSGKLAKTWMEETVNKLRQRMSGELGMVLQDGGFPISGFAKQISPGEWDQVAREFFLTK